MKLSVIGIGNMGRAIACATLSGGHEVTVYNRTSAKSEALARRRSGPERCCKRLRSAMDFTRVC
jgi:3-hydroxyisobutyrate dehydrogenase-like beta-hydroxyacid dehydrogenase